MVNAKTLVTITGFIYFLLSTNLSANPVQTTQSGTKSVQTKSKTAKTGTRSKPVQKAAKSEPVKNKDDGSVLIGTQKWAKANLTVSTFRNGDSIPEAKTNKEWVAAGDAGKPAWCYYNNNLSIGLKYGKLYNWFAVNDPRGLAPVGWALPGDADWVKLANFMGPTAGSKMKSNSGWNEDNNGTNESGFAGFPGGYRIENGIFQNIGTIGIWWSTKENNPLSAFDHYLSQSASISRSNSPKQRGESVRCIKE
jgi:uncharacterized protein (TIGR02145 family)